MKAKVVVSLGTVVGLAVLSAAAFISTAGTAGASPAVGQREDMQAAICQEELEIKEKERRLSVESVSLPEPTEEPPQTESESRSPEDSYLLAKIAMAEAESEDTEGKALVIAPQSTLGVSRTERDTEKLRLLWAAGYQGAIDRLEEIRDYLRG